MDANTHTNTNANTHAHANANTHTLSERRRLYLIGRAVVARYYRSPLTLDAVARALSVSPRALQRAYAQFGDSFHEDLLARRMRTAAKLLIEQPAIPVASVGRLVGYRSASHFALAFRRRYSLSPAQFRALARTGARGQAGAGAGSDHGPR